MSKAKSVSFHVHIHTIRGIGVIVIILPQVLFYIAFSFSDSSFAFCRFLFKCKILEKTNINQKYVYIWSQPFRICFAQMGGLSGKEEKRRKYSQQFLNYINQKQNYINN